MQIRTLVLEKPIDLKCHQCGMNGRIRGKPVFCLLFILIYILTLTLVAKCISNSYKELGATIKGGIN